MDPNKSRSPQYRRTVPTDKTETLSKAKATLKDPKRMVIISLFVLFLGIVPFVSALTYTVQEGDTLTAIARKYNTTVEEIAAANGIDNVNLILIGQELEITENTVDAMTSSGSSSGSSSGLALKSALDTQFNVPVIAPTSEKNPDVGRGQACTRFNFDDGDDAETGSRDGVFIMFDDTNGAIASWYGPAGATDSGWINGFDITFDEVYVQVLFYPNDGKAVPVMMEVVNPAPGTPHGWLNRGRCHAIEIQYAD